MQEYEKQKARDESQFKKFEDMVKQENEEQEEALRQKLRNWYTGDVGFVTAPLDTTTR